MAKNYLALYNELKAKGPEQEEELNSRVLIVDGLNTFIRSYSVSPVTNSNGEHVGGISGFLLSVGHAIKTINPTRVIIVFDGKDGSAKRRAIFSDYKSNRKLKVRLNRSETVDKEDNQLQQLMRLVEYLGVLPFTTIVINGAEADDVIAYLTKHFYEGRDNQLFIMSSDKDFMQLVDKQTHIWSPTDKKLYFEQDVYERFGIIPANMALFRALTGDSSDNIPGVEGLGAKTLIQRFPQITEDNPMSLDQFFDYATTLRDDNPKIKLYQKVLDSRAEVEKYFNITQLSESMISGQIRLKIVEMMNAPTHRLSKVKFHTMLIENGMTTTIKNVEMWIREITQKLDRFALQG